MIAFWFIRYIQASKSAASLPSGGESRAVNQPALLSCAEGKTERDPIVTATAILKITGLGKTGEHEGGKKKCFSFSNKNGSR